MLQKGKVPEEVINALKQENSCPLFKWVDPQGKKDEAVFKQIDNELMDVIRAMAGAAQARQDPLPIKEINDLIFRKCVLWPILTEEELESLVIGAVPTVIKSIQLKSGLVDIDIFGRPIGHDTNVSLIKDFTYWPDLSEEDKEKLKKESPWQLYRVRYGRWVFVMRPLTRLDIKLSYGTEDETFNIVRSVVVWPKEIEWGNIPTGAVEALMDSANKISGYSTEPEIEEL